MVRAPMPPSRRAKIFSMFDALKGLKEALAAQERIPEPRRYLAEDAMEELNRKLTSLKKGQIATVVYYCEYAQEYNQLTGPVDKVDFYWSMIQIGSSCIGFGEIFDVVDVNDFRSESGKTLHKNGNDK